MNETFKKILMERVNNIPKRDDIKEYECPICRDLHYTFNDLGQAVPCKCKDKFESKEKLKKCEHGKPHKYWSFTQNTKKIQYLLKLVLLK